MRYALLGLALLASPAAGQITATLPVTCNAGGICVPSSPIVNPDGTLIGNRGATSLATGQASVGTTSTLVAAASPTRKRIVLTVGAANACAFGNAGVTTTTGFPLQPVAGATLTLDTTAAVYAACSATTTVSFIGMLG